VYVRKSGALAKPESIVLKNRERGGKWERERTRVSALQTRLSHFKPQGINFKRQSIALDKKC